MTQTDFKDIVEETLHDCVGRGIRDWPTVHRIMRIQLNRIPEHRERTRQDIQVECSRAANKLGFLACRTRPPRWLDPEDTHRIATDASVREDLVTYRDYWLSQFNRVRSKVDAANALLGIPWEGDAPESEADAAQLGLL